MVIVRLLLFLSLTTMGAALLMYFVKRDRRYLRFLWQVVKFTVFVLLAVLIMFAAERVLAPAIAPLL